jgi:hypothetical protein
MQATQLTTARPVLKKLTCPNCGSPVDQFSPDAQTIVCKHCGGYIAVGVDQPALLSEGRKLPAPPVPIEVGQMAQLQNTAFIVLGRVVYEGWDPHDQSDRWQWNEWQLGGADGRLLWLAHDEDGFALYRKLKLRQAFDPLNDRTLPVGGESPVRVHERYPARILGAEGELTFRARRDDRLTMVEAAGDGKKYSIQVSDQELEVHEGIRLDAAQVASAFNRPDWIKTIERSARRTASFQWVGGLMVLFAMISLVAAITVNGSGDALMSQTVTLNSASPMTTIPIDFGQSGRPAIIRVRLAGNLPVNSGVEVGFSMISPNQMENYLFSMDFWHETGVDDEGPWTDIRSSASKMFVPQQQGLHTLEVELTGVTQGFNQPVTAQVTVMGNHIMPSWFIGYGVVFGVLGLAMLFIKF